MCWDQNHLFRFDAQGICRVLEALGFDEVSARPIQLLSLKPEHYADGRVMPSWTRSARLNRLMSKWAVGFARVLHLHNKILVRARKRAE